MVREYPERPIVAVGGIVVRNGQVLLIQRGREPSAGRWTIPGGAVRVGERFVTSQDVSPAPDTKVVGESLEGSNVNPVEEFARLIEITRHYESIQKVVQAMDDEERQAASEIGRPV